MNVTKAFFILPEMLAVGGIVVVVSGAAVVVVVVSDTYCCSGDENKFRTFLFAQITFDEARLLVHFISTHTSGPV